MKSMKLLKLSVAILTLLTSFQNCARVATFSSSSGVTALDTPQSKVLGLYDFANVAGLKYHATGGLVLPSASPQLTINFSQGSTVGSVSMIDPSSGSTICSVDLPLDSNAAQQLNLALGKATLSASSHQFAATDCGSAFLDLSLNDSSEHIYTFDNICSPNGALTIADNGSSLATLLDQFAHQVTCP